MAAKPLNPALAEKVVADWRTGEYSIRDLADRHKISRGAAGNLVKGIPKDGAAIVDAGIQYRQALAAQDGRMVDAITEVVDKKVQRLEWLSTAAIKNVSDAMKATCTDQQDFRHRANTIKHALEVVDPPKSSTVAVQVNNSIGRNLKEMTDDELLAIATGGG